jgi:hypothetical protein
VRWPTARCDRRGLKRGVSKSIVLTTLDRPLGFGARLDYRREKLGVYRGHSRDRTIANVAGADFHGPTIRNSGSNGCPSSPMKLITRLLFIVPTLALLSNPAAAADGAKRDAEGGEWRTAPKCGLNALYLFLKGHGYSVNYRELERLVPIGPRGSSLLEMKKAATRLGVRVDVCKATPSALTSADLPFIAHYHGQTGSGDHYVLVLGFDGSIVDLIDGTTALRRDVPIEHFRRDWDGYCLMRSPNLGALLFDRYSKPAFLCVGVLTGYFALRLRPAPRNRAVAPTLTGSESRNEHSS